MKAAYIQPSSWVVSGRNLLQVATLLHMWVEKWLTGPLLDEAAWRFYQLVFFTPEMQISNKNGDESLRVMHTLKDLEVLVMDEAHCIKTVSHMSCCPVHSTVSRNLHCHCRGCTFWFVLKRNGEVCSLIRSRVRVMGLLCLHIKLACKNKNNSAVIHAVIMGLALLIDWWHL